jgi:hypothetical protein
MRKLLFGIGLVWAIQAGAVAPDFRQFDTNYFNTNNLRVSLQPAVITAIGNTNNYLSINSYAATNRPVNLLEVFSMNPFSQVTNVWIEMGRTNSNGERLIYGTMTATNHVYLFGLSNAVRGSLLSFNVIASGGSRSITINSNLVPHFDTNVWTVAGARLQVLLQQNHEARLTFQSNDTMSVICYTPEQ